MTGPASDLSDPERPRIRSDAQQNRERILSAAREAFGESDDVSLNSIAKRAGVGPGTLYRHFPSREALVLAVYQDDVRALTDAAADMLAGHQPLRALRLWFEHLARDGIANRSLAGALQAASSAGETGHVHAAVAGAAAMLLSACQEEGSIRPDIAADDVLLLLSFLWRMEPGPDAANQISRILDLIVSGLRAGAPHAPPSRMRRRPIRHSLRRRLSIISLGTPRSRGSEGAAPRSPAETIMKPADVTAEHSALAD